MKRGISPVIAAVLLVIIAVAAGVLVWTWISGFAQRNPVQEPALSERIKIDAVSVSDDRKTVTIFVRNLGETVVTIESAFILNATNGNVVCKSIGLNAEIPIGGVSSENDVKVTCDSPLSPGVYIAKVVTSRGVEATYQFVVS